MKNKIIFLILLLIVFVAPSCFAKNFKVATYNVENLFDLKLSGTEYIEYAPNGPYGWDKNTFNIKLNNIAKVIKDLEADIIALQEIESKTVLIQLRKRLKTLEVDYPYMALADAKQTVVKCAILSKFPIKNKTEIRLRNKSARNILQVTLDIQSFPLLIFVNHWKSKQGPESMRLTYARALKKQLKQLKKSTDFIIIGDLNSNYNEHKSFFYSSRLNNTSGKTGINHVLKTIKNNQFIDERFLIEEDNYEYLYNLWLELDEKARWSHNFFGIKGTPDAIIIGKALYDNKGISYVDNSFGRFEADYLLKGEKIYRWQRSRNGKGKHLGKGYSDHLPVFAVFSTDSQL